MSAPGTRDVTTYTPHEAADRTGLTLETLRYYEREGLVGPVDRTAGGRRQYTANDLSWVSLITCLRDAGLGISDLRDFTQLLRTDDADASDRVEFLRGRRDELLARLDATRRALTVLDDKIAYYGADGPAP